MFVTSALVLNAREINIKCGRGLQLNSAGWTPHLLKMQTTPNVLSLKPKYHAKQ